MQGLALAVVVIAVIIAAALLAPRCAHARFDGAPLGSPTYPAWASFNEDARTLRAYRLPGPAAFPDRTGAPFPQTPPADTDRAEDGSAQNSWYRGGTAAQDAAADRMRSDLLRPTTQAVRTGNGYA